MNVRSAQAVEAEARVAGARSRCARARCRGPAEAAASAGVAAFAVLAVLAAAPAHAQQSLDLLTVKGPGGATETWSVSLQVLLFMTVLSLLPAVLITMTAFTRIVVVLAILRQGLGTQQTPSNQILVGIALFLTAFVMAPVGARVYDEGVRPYLDHKLAPAAALEAAAEPVREFMLNQTRDNDLALFARLAGRDLASAADVPYSLLLPAFVTSELKTAFEVGFVLLVPFLVIDLVVASALMSVGMVMLSPLIVSLPFKIMLFVLVDGWTLVMTTLAGSFVH
ncbi:MAG TPA: flagellar type III secretion system pore protein FliP [Gammaproteobacteria bacterium]|nr:flagellar type III secretion system pore protein FliP [Gammaproteobacteria bacterium]